MKYLSEDLIRNIAWDLKFKEILKISVINKLLYLCLDKYYSYRKDRDRFHKPCKARRLFRYKFMGFNPLIIERMC